MRELIEEIIATLAALPSFPTIDVLMTWPVMEIYRWGFASIRSIDLFKLVVGWIKRQASKPTKKDKAKEMIFWRSMLQKHPEAYR